MSYTLVMLPPRSEQTARWGVALEDAVPGVRVLHPAGFDEAATALREADAAFGTLPPDLMPNATRLRWLQAPQAGPPKGFYHQGLIEHPVVVTNLRATYTDHVATHAVTMVLTLARGLHTYRDAQSRRQWVPDEDPTHVLHLPEATVLVAGLGAVGAEVARLLAAFGARVVGTDARLRQPPPGVAELAPPDEIDRLLPDADVVVLTVPHTPATEGMVDAEFLARMRPTAKLVNVGRGALVRLDDLVAALRAGGPAAAALDVFEQEPLPADHPLWTMPNVLLTPHVAGVGPHTEERRLETFLHNARRFAAGEPLVNVVDKTAWF